LGMGEWAPLFYPPFQPYPPLHIPQGVSHGMGLAWANPLIHIGLIDPAHGLAWLGELTDRPDGLLMGQGYAKYAWGGPYHFRLFRFANALLGLGLVLPFPYAFPIRFPFDKHGLRCFSFLFFCAVFTPLIDLVPIDWLSLLLRDT